MDSPEFLRWKDIELQQYLKGTPWKVYQTDKGKPYYYQKVTKVTQWTKPEDIKAFEDTLSIENYKKSQKPQAAAASPVMQTKVVKTVTKEELEQLLERRDCILDPKAAATAKTLHDVHNVSNDQIIDKFVSSYSGYPAMTRMLVEWIKLANILQEAAPAKNDGFSASSSNNTTSNVVLSGASNAKVDYFGSDAFGDEIMAPYLSELIKLRFNRKAADSLVTTSNADGDTDPSSLPVLPNYIHTLAQNATYKEAFQELYKVQDHSTLLRAICTGAYTTPTSTAHDNTKGATTEGTATSEQVFIALCVEVEQFDRISELVDNFIQATTAVDAADASGIQDKILNLIRTSSEVVKYFSLQVLRSKVNDLKEALSESSKENVSSNAMGATQVAGESRKRQRSEDSVEEGEEDGSMDAKRVRVDEGGASSNSSGPSSNSESNSVSMGDGAGARAKLLSVLHSLYDDVSHTEGSALTTDVYTSSTKQSSSANASDEALRKIVEKMVQTQALTAEDVQQLHDLYFSQHTSAELNSGHPTTAYLLHHLVQQHLVIGLVRSVTEKATESSEEEISYRNNVCNLLNLAARRELNVAAPESVGWLEETLALCRELQDAFYGVMHESKCAQLVSLARSCPLCARLIVAWATYHCSDDANTNNVFFVSVLPTMCEWIKAAAEGHPVLLEPCLESAKAVLSAGNSILQAGDHEDVAKMSLLTELVTVAQRAGLELCVQLIAAGYSKHTLLYLVSIVEQLDVDMVRVLLHMLLEIESLDSLFPTASSAALLVAFFCTDSSLRALNSQHFDRVDIAKLALLVSHISALSALPAETQVQCADLLVLCRR